MSDTTRADAERIARGHLAAGGFEMADATFTVRTLAEVHRPPMLYGLANPEEDLARSWLVYVSDVPDLPVLKSSWLVVVARANRAVLYSGSAYDEG